MKHLLCLVIALPLFGCGETEQVPPQISAEEEIQYVIQAQPVTVTPEQAAEVFALGSDATDLQRELLKKELIGNVIEWDVTVYEIQREDGNYYKVTSQPIPIKSKQATELLRMVAFVVPRNDADLDVLQITKSNDVIRVHGKVQDVVMRTVLVIRPAIVVK